MSAIGSVIVIAIPPSPARLRHARNLASVDHLSQANTTQPELAIDGFWPTTSLAAGVRAYLELWCLLLLVDKCFFCHRINGSPVGMGSQTLIKTLAPHH